MNCTLRSSYAVQSVPRRSTVKRHLSCTTGDLKPTATSCRS